MAISNHALTSRCRHRRSKCFSSAKDGFPFRNRQAAGASQLAARPGHLLTPDRQLCLALLRGALATPRAAAALARAARFLASAAHELRPCLAVY